MQQEVGLVDMVDAHNLDQDCKQEVAQDTQHC